MTETHIDRKDLKSPDAFFVGVGSFNRFIQENRALAIGGTIALILAFAGIAGWRTQSRRAEENAAAAFLRATDAVEESSFESARSALATVASDAGRPYGPLASLYLAELELKSGNADASAAAYGVVANELDRDYLKQAALVGRAFALETAGKPAEAAKAYGEAAGVASTYKESALRAQLRTAKAAGDTELTKTALKALVETYPQGADADALSSELAALGD